MGISCSLYYLEDDLPDIEIFSFDKATPCGIRASSIVAVFCNIWVPGSVPGEVEDEYDCIFYFTVEQILRLRNHQIVSKIMDWEGLDKFLRVSAAKRKRFYFSFSH